MIMNFFFWIRATLFPRKKAMPDSVMSKLNLKAQRYAVTGVPSRVIIDKGGYGRVVRKRSTSGSDVEIASTGTCFPSLGEPDQMN